ncbi:MAG: peptidoglycan editing factor PgeF [Candidatus Omnitrophica bacterium]|nr:peptidoglycan editing factor PgeF [Candidatus Omnitrophota bacterium]
MIFSYPGLVCATSGKPYNMSLTLGQTQGALLNRKVFLDGLGIEYRDLVCAKQVHGDCIRWAGEPDKGKGALEHDTALDDTDALLTDKRNLPLAIFTADCLPIFLFDPQRPAVGLVHAGRRGTEQEITPKAIRLMQDKFNSRPGELFVGFGPAIRDCCYEVGVDLKDNFNYGLKMKDSRYYLDIILINKKQVLESGVKPNHISDCGICTSCRQDEFFSYRRHGAACGRMISVIMLR